MAKNQAVSVSVETELKKRAEQVAAERGISTEEAATRVYKRVPVHGDAPAQPVVLNETTHSTFEKTDKGEDLIVCEDAEDMFKRLDL